MYSHTVYYKGANMIVSTASIIDPYLFTLFSFYRSLAAMQNHNIEVCLYVLTRGLTVKRTQLNFIGSECSLHFRHQNYLVS